jgi:hypothetical protein
VGLEDAGIVQQRFDLFERMDDFDQPRVVIKEGAVRDRSESLVEFGEFGVCLRCIALAGSIESADSAESWPADGSNSASDLLTLGSRRRVNGSPLPVYRRH